MLATLLVSASYGQSANSGLMLNWYAYAKKVVRVCYPFTPQASILLLSPMSTREFEKAFSILGCSIFASVQLFGVGHF